MLHLTGEEQFDQPPEELWRRLVDPRFLCDSFPGVDSVERADARSAKFVVRPGFSFVRGTLEVAFEFVHTQPPADARASIAVRGIGSSAELEARFHLVPAAGGTSVTWAIEATALGGLLKAVSQGLLQAAAQKVATDTWQRIRSRLTEPS